MSISCQGRKVLVTGGTGPFGRTVATKLLAARVDEVRILSHDEEKQYAMRHVVEDPRARFYIGDVRDATSFDRVVRGIDHVFHAAALKPVPSCEFFPLDAVETSFWAARTSCDSAKQGFPLVRQLGSECGRAPRDPRQDHLDEERQPS